MALMWDMGAYEKHLAAVALGTGATAAATKSGIVIDRLSTSYLNANYNSCKYTVIMNYSKTSVGAWTVTPRLQHSSSTASSTFAALSSGTAITLTAAGTTGSNLISQGSGDQNLVTAKRYLRMQIVHGARTSIAGNSYNTMGVISFGGSDVTPAT